MCRHLAYLGPPATLRSVIIEPPHGLYQQAWAPRRQRYGTVNADGFGVGWYAAGDPVPARYRQTGPIWGDESFADVARVTRAGAILGAVRGATAGTDPGPAAVAPFAAGSWLFSHNGVIAGWPDSAAGLAATLDSGMLLGLAARVDSALLWALVLDRLRRGLGPAEALADTIVALDAAGVTGRFNFLLTDGRVIAGTAAGDTLWYRPGLGVVVASEPGDDEPGWIQVRPDSVITATPQQVSVMKLSRSIGSGSEMSAEMAANLLPPTEGYRSHDLPGPAAAARLPVRSAARGRPRRAHGHAQVTAAQVVL